MARDVHHMPIIFEINSHASSMSNLKREKIRDSFIPIFFRSLFAISGLKELI